MKRKKEVPQLAVECRLFPTKGQKKNIENIFKAKESLYNIAYKDRQDHWELIKMIPKELRNHGIGLGEQEKMIKVWRSQFDPDESIHTHIFQSALKDLDSAYQRFFDNIKKRAQGQKVKLGFPKPKKPGKVKSFRFKDVKNKNGFELIAKGKRARISGVGKVKIKVHRTLPGPIAEVTIKKKTDGKYYAILVCDIDLNVTQWVSKKPIEKTGKKVSMDLGIKVFGSLSDGSLEPSIEPIENPKFIKQFESKIRNAQIAMQRKQKGSKNRSKAKALLRKHYAKLTRCREDFARKLANDSGESYDIIYIERLNIVGMHQGKISNRNLSKYISDASWGRFKLLLKAKAKSCGKEVIEVDPKDTSKTCSNCGCVAAKILAERMHSCIDCGYTIDRDYNAARNIFFIGSGGKPPAPMDFLGQKELLSFSEESGSDEPRLASTLEAKEAPSISLRD